MEEQTKALALWSPTPNQMMVWRTPREQEIPWTAAGEWWSEDWENPDGAPAESSSTFTVALWPKQLEFFECDETFAALVGGIGSGKSHGLVLWTIVQRLLYAGSKGLMVGPTLVNLRATTMVKFFQLLEPIRDQVVDKWRVSDRELTFKNGSVQLFWGADDEGVIQRMRGLEIADFELDEAALISGSVMDVLPGRLRQVDKAGKPYPYRGRMATTHDGEDWLYQQFGCDGTSRAIGRIWHTSIYENEDLPPEYIRTVEMLFTDTEYAKQELLGGHAKFSGLMYPGFDTTTHIIDTLPRFKRLVLCFDWGFHFAPVIALGVTDDDQVVVAREWYGQRVTIDQQADGALEVVRELGFNVNDVDGFADPSRPENRLTVQQRTGIGFPTFEAGHITEGAIEFARLLRRREDGKPGLVVHRSCVWWIKEIRGYQRKERPGRSQNDPTRFADEPAPGQLDHAMDATRYGVRGLSQTGLAQNAISFLTQTNPTCMGCGRRFYFPLNVPTMKCPHCGREAKR